MFRSAGRGIAGDGGRQVGRVSGIVGRSLG